MVYRSSHLEEVTWPSSRHPESFWLLWRIHSSYQHFVPRFRISSKNGSRKKLNHPKQRRSPTLSRCTSLIYPYWELQWYFQISLFRFRITSKNGSRDKLNEINQRWSPDPLLVLQHHFRYSRCYRQNQLPGPWYSESPRKTDPKTGQIVQIYFWPN
jgi:hypothetical protein